VTGVFVVPPMSAVSAVIHPMMGTRSESSCTRGSLHFGVLAVAGLDRSLGDVTRMVPMIMHVILSLSSLV
jgi:hypothetical protein